MQNQSHIQPTLFKPNYVSSGHKVTIIDKPRPTTTPSDCDSNLKELSSFKLLSILRLHRIEGCELEVRFIRQVKAELQSRGDSQTWNMPH